MGRDFAVTINNEDRLRDWIDMFDSVQVYLANKFGLDPSVVEAGIDEEGVPILAEDCMVTIHNPQRWL